MKDRDLLRERRVHQRLHNRSLKSDPTSPVDKELEKGPLDLRRVLSGSRGGSQRSRGPPPLLVSNSSSSNYYPQLSAPFTAPPAIPNTSTLGADIAVEALRRRQQIGGHQHRRRSSGGGQPVPAAVPLSANHPLSPRQRFLSSSSWSTDQAPESAHRSPRALTISMGHWDSLRAQFQSPKHSTASSMGPSQQMPKGSVASTLSCPPPMASALSTNAITLTTGAQQQQAHSPLVAQQSVQAGPGEKQQHQQQHPFPAPKSKFKMAHESFRARMLQEMQDNNEAVFMTKKRQADSKFSEFKGGKSLFCQQ